MNPRPLLRSLFVCLLSLAPLLPGAARAAEDAPLRTRFALMHMPDAPEAPPRLQEEEPARARASRGLRLLAEVGGGAVGSLGGSLVGGLVGGGVCLATGLHRRTENLGCLGTMALGVGAGLLVGYPVGVWGAGEVMGGDGRLWASVLGTGLGIMTGALLLSGLGPERSGSEVFLLAPFVLGAAGGVAGYELSQAEAPAAMAFKRPRFQPLVSVSGRGALLGLGGRF